MQITMILCIVLVGCQISSTFDGNTISNADRFQMDYTVLDRQESASLVLNEGDSIRVSIAQNAGTVDVTVGIDGKEPIYEGNGLTNAAFVLNVWETGMYQIVVTGHNACGSVSFVKAAAE